MPNATVGTLHAKFMADTRDFTDGLEAIEVSQRDLKRIQRDATTQTDKYNDELLKLKAALAQGKISQEQFNKALAKSKSRLKEVSSQTRTATGRWTDFKSQIDLITGSIRTAHAAFSTFMEGVANSNSLESMRKSVEVTRKEFAALTIAAEDVGHDAQAVRDMFRDIADAVDDILKGGADTDVLNRLGITPEDLRNAGSSFDRLIMLKDALMKQPAQSRISLAKQLGGPEMLEILQSLEDMGGAQVAFNRARERGTILTDEQHEANRELAQTWSDLNASVKNFFATLDADTIKALTALINDLSGVIKDAKELFNDIQGLISGKGGGLGIAKGGARLFDRLNLPNAIAQDLLGFDGLSARDKIDKIEKQQLQEQKKSSSTLKKLEQSMTAKFGRPVKLRAVRLN